MLTANEVARYFLAIQDPDAGDLMSNLKLQKLVYYAQGFHLAIHGDALFPEKIKAWVHGPVVPQLWHQYRDHQADPIPIPADVNLSTYGARVRKLLDEIYQVYGQFSAWALRNMTHEEPPWQEAYESASKVITLDSMRSYFKTRLVDQGS